MTIPSILNNKHGLIFDFDGTLANSMPAHNIAWQRAILKYNITITNEILDTLCGHTSKEIATFYIKKYALPITNTELSREKDLQYLSLLDMVTFIPKTYNILTKALKTHKIAIGTNEDSFVFTEVATHFKLSIISDVIVSWDQIMKPKPHPDIFLKCASLLSLENHHCHVFEDSVHGIEAAKRAGMSFTHVNDINE